MYLSSLAPPVPGAAKMWGSMDKQVARLFNVAVNEVGQSRHAAKAIARENGAKTHQDLGRELAIYSYGTSNTYLPIWKQLARFAAEKGCKDIEKISNRIVKQFLQQKMKDVNKYSSYQKILSAISKMEVALERYAEKEQTGKEYDWSRPLGNMRKLAQSPLKSEDGTERPRWQDSIVGRGFSDPQKIVDAVEDPQHQLVARIQSEAGVRVSEAARISSDQLLGVREDPRKQCPKEGEVGVIRIKGKGGKVRDVYVSKKTYAQLKSECGKSGNDRFEVDQRRYYDSVKTAAYACQQKYTGTHDFRHSWVQSRFRELSLDNNTDNTSLSVSSEEIGHVRPDITEVYLR